MSLAEQASKASSALYTITQQRWGRGNEGRIFYLDTKNNHGYSGDSRPFCGDIKQLLDDNNVTYTTSSIASGTRIKVDAQKLLARKETPETDSGPSLPATTKPRPWGLGHLRFKFFPNRPPKAANSDRAPLGAAEIPMADESTFPETIFEKHAIPPKYSSEKPPVQPVAARPPAPTRKDHKPNNYGVNSIDTDGLDDLTTYGSSSMTGKLEALQNAAHPTADELAIRAGENSKDGSTAAAAPNTERKKSENNATAIRQAVLSALQHITDQEWFYVPDTNQARLDAPAHIIEACAESLSFMPGLKKHTPEKTNPFHQPHLTIPITPKAPSILADKMKPQQTISDVLHVGQQPVQSDIRTDTVALTTPNGAGRS